jgi:hypothetical protein
MIALLLQETIPTINGIISQLKTLAKGYCIDGKANKI